MAEYSKEKAGDLGTINHLISTQDRSKELYNIYEDIMWEQQTVNNLKNSNFEINEDKMKAIEKSFFTSLIIKLDEKKGKVFFDQVRPVYKEIKKLVNEYYKDSKPEIYLESAHITIRSIRDNQEYDEVTLEEYLPIVKDIIIEKIISVKDELTLYGMGLITNLHPKKGLSIGIRFYPSIPYIKEIRDKVKIELDKAVKNCKLDESLTKRKEGHTMLIHSTGMRIRDLPFTRKNNSIKENAHYDKFVEAFIDEIPKYQNNVFGTISKIGLDDIYIRNGKSDKLSLGREICFKDYI